MSEVEIEADTDRQRTMRTRELEFVYCDACATLVGAQTLCQGCIHNQDVFGRLRKRVELLEGASAAAQTTLSLAYRHLRVR